jgi:hypothetical protein
MRNEILNWDGGNNNNNIKILKIECDGNGAMG